VLGGSSFGVETAKFISIVRSAIRVEPQTFYVNRISGSARAAAIAACASSTVA
jgi:hypothetical protein